MSIKIRNITKVFSDSKVALKDINIEFKKNQITGLIGFNGSGKTTLYNIILNFIEDKQGEVLLDNKPITQEDLKYFTFLGGGDANKNSTIVIRYLLSIADIYFIPKKIAEEKIRELSKKMDFTEFLGKPIKSLSKGNQQKIKVIASLLNPNTKYLILDEPFDGLDPLMVKKIAKIYLSLKDTTIVITSHRMEVVQDMCKEFYVIKDGLIIDSKTVDQEIVFVSANKEISIDTLKDKEYIQNIIETKKDLQIEIKDISFYKDLTKILLNDNKYIYSTIKEKNIAESVFLGYGDENE